MITCCGSNTSARLDTVELSSISTLLAFFVLKDVEFAVLIAWWVHLTCLHITETVSSSNLKVLLFDYVEKCVAKGKKNSSQDSQTSLLVEKVEQKSFY